MGVQITQKNTTQSNYVDKDSFVISVAKGSKVTLSETWTQSLAASVTHKEAKDALKLGKQSQPFIFSYMLHIHKSILL